MRVSQKKFWGLILGLVIMLSLTYPGLAQREQVIVHWQHHHESRTPALQEMAAIFMERNPGVTIQFENIPYDTYFDKVMTALASGIGPDVFQLPMGLGIEMTRSGMLAPVPEEVYSMADIARDFVSWTTSQFYYNGKYYGLPTDVQTLIVFANNALMREAGLDPNNPPETWSEFLEQARAATKRDGAGRIIQAGLDTRYRWAVINLFLEQGIDGPVTDLNEKRVRYADPDGLAGWEYITKLMTGPQAVDSPTFLAGQMKFEQEKAVFYINHPVTRGRLELNHPDIDWSVFPVPYPDGGELCTVGHHWAYAVNKESSKQELAWEWIKYITGKEGQLKWVHEAGDLPSLIELVNDPVLQYDTTARLAIESMKYAVPHDAVGRMDIDEIRDEIWDRIILEGLDYQEAARRGADRETRLLQRKLR